MFLVYLIRNIVNEKFYIGCTGESFKQRWYVHCWEARKGSKLYFHCAIRKYKPESFRYEILATVLTSNDAKNLERLWIRALDADNSEIGYNMSPGGDTVGRDKRGKPSGMKGKHFIYITDGLQNRMIRSGNENTLVPVGWKKGITTNRNHMDFHHSSKTKKVLSQKAKTQWNISVEKKLILCRHLSEFNTGTIWITDGLANRKIRKDSIIPTGWKQGKSHKKKPGSRNCSNCGGIFGLNGVSTHEKNCRKTTVMKEVA